ncbi:MAG: hypothetical protein HZC36_13300 [Armatimonadetes bacterium]|nr:hypothetical protein [Armatimonadota bacterium]
MKDEPVLNPAVHDPIDFVICEIAGEVSLGLSASGDSCQNEIMFGANLRIQIDQLKVVVAHLEMATTQDKFDVMPVSVMIYSNHKPVLHSRRNCQLKDMVGQPSL